MAECIKYGIQIPNRVFVGGVAFDTKEEELKQFFTDHGKVKDCKIVTDKDGNSRGFGFVTFESKQDAVQVQKLGTVFFKQKKLNLGPAIRQKGVVFNNSQEQANEPVVSSGVYIHPSGYCYTVAPNGMWYFHANSDEQTNGHPTMQQLPPQTPTPPATTCSPPPVPVSMFSTDSVPTQYAAPNQYIPASPTMSVVPAQQTSTDIPVGYLPADAVTPYFQWYPHNASPVNHFPITSPPPVANHQAHPMQPGAYFLPVSNPRPELYHFVTSPVDSTIMERGPVIPYESILRPTPLRPAMPVKRFPARLPLNEKRIMDSRFIPNGMLPNAHATGKVIGVAEK